MKQWTRTAPGQFILWLLILLFGEIAAAAGFASLYMLPAASMPGTLEAKINFVTLKRDEIVIQITPKAYSTK